MFKLQSLTNDRVFICIESLLEHGSEEKLEYMCKLLTTVGHLLETPECAGTERMDVIFRKIQEIVNKSRSSKSTNNYKISSRVRFMMQDVIDLRGRIWDHPQTHLQSHSHQSQQQMLSQQQQQQQQQQQHMSSQRRSALGGGRQDDKMGGGGGGGNQRQYYQKSHKSQQYMQQHEQKLNIDSHAEHLPFKCDYCARLFKHKRSRDRHTKLHTGDRRYRCSHCEAAFSRSDHLKIHMKTHDNQKPFQCTKCNRGYNTAAALTSHMQNHKTQATTHNCSPRSNSSVSNGGSFHKKQTATTYSNANNKLIQFNYLRRPRSVSLLTCNYCSKSDFKTTEHLNAHIQTKHEKEIFSTQKAQSLVALTSSEKNTFLLTCEYCTMNFENLAALFQHTRLAHIDRIASSCSEHFNRLSTSGTFSPRLAAEKTASQKDNIRVEKTEQGEEPTDLSQNKRQSTTPVSLPEESLQSDIFFCNQCNAGLPNFEKFLSHLKSHLALGLNFVCIHCGLAFEDQSEHERHVISHYLITSSEYNCPSAKCEISYVRPEELQRHMMDQHSIPMIKCTVCSEIFETEIAIQMHFAQTHSEETKLLRCSACLETFRSENVFNTHVRTSHPNLNKPLTNLLQCMFCRTECASELEMHIHLAVHVRQFQCPSCPETFHVEFLRDRHIQSHHPGNNPTPLPSKGMNEEVSMSSKMPKDIASIYINALLSKTTQMAISTHNYNIAFAGHVNENIFQGSPKATNSSSDKSFYDTLKVAENVVNHYGSMYGFSQHYLETSQSLIDMCTQQTVTKTNSVEDYYNNCLKTQPVTQYLKLQSELGQTRSYEDVTISTAVGANNFVGYSCDICERNDFHSESEVNSHYKTVHNIKTGISLCCAYCSGKFKSRSELEHHMKSRHNSNGKHKCMICDEVFPSPAILAEHKLQHSKIGQSLKCSHCNKPLNDVAAFKVHLSQHNNERQLPLQCICCRQSLHSDFEIGLHAQFHTKSSINPESICALCLVPIPNPLDREAKLCDKCYRKHKISSKFINVGSQNEFCKQASDKHLQIEMRCNICKVMLANMQKLQEHLVEHTFAGCEERGFNCYICSAIFTAPSSLLSHMHEHGLQCRPYDCNRCKNKFFFRAELDHHLWIHENQGPNEIRNFDENNIKSNLAERKNEKIVTQEKTATGEDDEYIDIEKVVDTIQIQQTTQKKTCNGLYK